MNASERPDPGMETPMQPVKLEARRSRRRRARGGDDGAGSTVAPGRRAWRVGLGAALAAWRPMLLVVLVQVLLALVVAAPFQARVAERLDHHGHAGALVGEPDARDAELGWERGLDAGLWRDLLRLERETLDGLALAVFWVSVLAWLFGAFAAGGFLGSFTAGGASGAGAFLVHGGRHMGRMLRVSLVLLVAVTLTGRLVLEAWGAAVADAEADAATGATAWWGERLREGVFVLLFLWLRLAADVARADLVLFARKSAFLAFFRGIGRTLRHPIRTFGLALGLGLPAFGLILLLGLPMQMIRGDGWVALVALFLIVQLAVWIRWMSRAAVLCGLAYQIRPQDIRPLPSPEERLAA